MIYFDEHDNVCTADNAVYSILSDSEREVVRAIYKMSTDNAMAETIAKCNSIGLAVTEIDVKSAISAEHYDIRPLLAKIQEHDWLSVDVTDDGFIKDGIPFDCDEKTRLLLMCLANSQEPNAYRIVVNGNDID